MALIDSVYDVLCEKLNANDGGHFIFYEDLAELVGLQLPSDELNDCLRQIAIREYEEKGLFPTLIVVSKRSGMPSDGFFDIAHQLNAFEKNDIHNQRKLFFNYQLGELLKKWKNFN